MKTINETFENFAISFHDFCPCRQFGVDAARFTWHSSRMSVPLSGRSVQRREAILNDASREANKAWQEHHKELSKCGALEKK